MTSNQSECTLDININKVECHMQEMPQTIKHTAGKFQDYDMLLLISNMQSLIGQTERNLYVSIS